MVMVDDVPPELQTPPTSIRAKAKGRQFALAHAHPDVARVDMETFWIIFRDGLNTALSDSARLATMWREAAEWIVLMGQARDAAPETCPHCGGLVVRSE